MKRMEGVLSLVGSYIPSRLDFALTLGVALRAIEYKDLKQGEI